MRRITRSIRGHIKHQICSSEFHTYITIKLLQKRSIIPFLYTSQPSFSTSWLLATTIVYKGSLFDTDEPVESMEASAVWGSGHQDMDLAVVAAAKPCMAL